MSANGIRVQKSVFDCMVPTTELELLVASLKRQMDADRDTLHVFPQCQACHDRRVEWGQVNSTMSDLFWIV